MGKKSDLKHAKLCYEHIGGMLGQLLLEQFVVKGWLARFNADDKNYYITEIGALEFEKIGIDLSKIKS